MNKKVFAYPYIVWMGIFIIVPMAMVVVCAFTADFSSSDFTFTLANFDRLINSELNYVEVFGPLYKACSYLYGYLSCYRLSCKLYNRGQKNEIAFFADYYVYNAYVDEFFAQNIRHTAYIEYRSVPFGAYGYGRGSGAGHGIQLSSFYDTAGVQRSYQNGPKSY